MKNEKTIKAVVQALRQVSTQAAALGIDLTKPGEVRSLILLHDLELIPIRKFDGPGDAFDSQGSRLEIKSALEGGTCQLGRFSRDNTIFKRISACDYVLFAWFSRVDPLRLASAYRVPAAKVAALALAAESAIPNCSISERWAANNGTSVLPGTNGP